MKLSRLMFLAGIGAGALSAAPITDTMNFSTTFGSPGVTSGSFTYDASQPSGSQFTSFNIVWDGFTFDMNAQANSPVDFAGGCTPAATSATFFALLSGSAQCTNSSGLDWFGELNGIQAAISICEQDGPNTSCSSSQGFIRASDIINSSGSPIQAGGTFSIVSQAAPEPSTFILTLTCGVFLAGKRYVRGKRRAT